MFAGGMRTLGIGQASDLAEETAKANISLVFIAGLAGEVLQSLLDPIAGTIELAIGIHLLFCGHVVDTGVPFSQ
jgi:hypothetical protein